MNTDFAKICITPRPPGAPVGKVPMPVLKELEHQARQNISTLNFTAAFAKTSSSCNASLEKCEHSIKSTVKKIKSQIQKGANPEKAAKRGYEEVAEYLDFWNKTVLVQHRALTCLSKSLAHILQRELYSMANTGLLRCEAEMTLLHPQLGETRRQELRNSSFWDSSLFESQLVKEGEDFLLKKGTSKDSQGFSPYQNKPFRGPHKNRGSYRKRPYGGNTSQSSNQSFPSGRGKSNFRGSRGRFRPHNRGRGRGNPPSQWLFHSLIQSTSRKLPPFFQERLANKQMFSKCVKHYHQWLPSAIPFKAKLDQIPSDSVRVQGPTKRPSLGHLYPVSLVKERHRKGGKRKISRVLQSPVPSTQASPKVEASHRLKQAQHFSPCRKVQNGNPGVHPDFPGPRGVGIVDRPVGRIPSHPHPSQLKEVPKVLLQGPGVPVHLPTFRTGHSPPGLYDDRKGSETNGPLKRTQNLPIPGRLADQVPVPGGISKGHTGSSRPNPILGLDNQPGKIRTETYSGVFIRGLRIPPRFSPCKTHSREMAQTSGFDPTTQVKTCFDCKMLDVSNWVASLNGENGPGGTPSHEALSVSSQGALEISSVAGQPPSLDRSHCSPPRLVAKSLKCDERRRPSSQGPQYPTLYRCLKRRLGRSLRSKFYKRAVVRAGKKATHKCPGNEGGLPGPSRLQGPVPESNSVSCDGQLNSGSLHQQARGNSLSRDLRSPVENHDLVPSLPYNIESQAHSRVSECDGRPSIQVQPSAVNRMVPAPSGLQANLPKVVHPSCRLIRYSPESQTPSIRVSYPRPKGLEHRCSEHKLDQPHGLRLPSYGSPSQGDPKDQAMPLPDHRDSPRLARDALVLGPSAALNRDPTTTPSVNDPTQTVPQLCVPQQSTTAEPPRLVSRSGQLQEQGFSVEVAERIAAPQRSSTRTIYRSKWALFEKWCRENSVDFSTPSVKQISDFFMYLYQDLNRRPSTIDGYRTAIVDTLGPTAQHIAHNADLHRLLSSFHRDRPKSSRNLTKWNLSVVLNELTKAPFEPMKDSDLKHLTLKTAFLLALASGKCRSEIHAWVANKVANLGQWEKVALFPSSDFKSN